MKRLTAGAAALSILAVALANHGAWSQTTRTIKIVVPSPPGGTTDLLARLLGEHIARTQSATVVIDNRPGAGEVIGTESVARAAPDGNTLLFAANPFVINPNLRKMNYDPVTSFEPICLLVTAPTLIVVKSTSTYRTLAELLDAARAKPGTITLGSIGPGSPFQFGFEHIKLAANVDMTFVPYPGNGPAVNALLGGHITMMFGAYGNVAEHLKTGRLRALAAGTKTRIEMLPHLPTVAESGFKGYEVTAWFGMFAPAKTSKETVAQLAGWFTTAMQAPDVKGKLEVQGLIPAGICGGDFTAYLRNQFEDYGRIIRAANIKGSEPSPNPKIP